MENTIIYRGIRFTTESPKFRRDFYRVAKILDADAITDADRRELLTIYNVSYHDSGKIQGLFSLDSSAHACEFCQRMHAAGADDKRIICGACYDWQQESYRSAVANRHALNMLIMSSVRFTVDELSRLPITGMTRVNSSGDTPNQIYAENMLNIAYAFPHIRFAYWAKHTAPIIAACDKLGKPDNLRLVQSSAVIGQRAQLARYFDVTFTVYPDRKTTEAAIAAGAMECNGKKCAECGYMCYRADGWTAGTDIAELLRGINAADRKALAQACACGD